MAWCHFWMLFWEPCYPCWAWQNRTTWSGSSLLVRTTWPAFRWLLRSWLNKPNKKCSFMMFTCLLSLLFTVTRLFCFLFCCFSLPAALSHFSDSILEYLANLDKAPDPSVRKDTFSSDIYAAFEILFNNWLQSREPKVGWSYKMIWNRMDYTTKKPPTFCKKSWVEALLKEAESLRKQK